MKYFLVLPFLLLLVGCFDDQIDNPLEDDDPLLKTQKGRTLKNVPYNIDSINRYAILKYNEQRIASYCNTIVMRLIQKNKKYSKNDDYDFFIDSQIMDSLKYYGFSAADTSQTGMDTKEIILYSREDANPGMFEKAKVSIMHAAKKHPTLFLKGEELFWTIDQPRVRKVEVKNEGGNLIEYTTKVKLMGGDEQNITYGLYNVNNKMMIKMQSFELSREPGKVKDMNEQLEEPIP